MTVLLLFMLSLMLWQASADAPGCEAAVGRAQTRHHSEGFGRHAAREQEAGLQIALQFAGESQRRPCPSLPELQCLYQGQGQSMNLFSFFFFFFFDGLYFQENFIWNSILKTRTIIISLVGSLEHQKSLIEGGFPYMNLYFTLNVIGHLLLLWNIVFIILSLLGRKE